MGQIKPPKRAFSRHQLAFHGKLKPLTAPKAFAAFLRPLFRHQWVVYCKPPFGGPEHVLKYLGSYTHRIAISNHRLISFDKDQVTFRWRDSAHGNKKRTLTISVTEFLRRFLLHVLRTVMSAFATKASLPTGGARLLKAYI